jgi:N4-gp56 family major capsid protein
MGSSADAAIQVFEDLSKSAGDRVRYPLIKNLGNLGVAGDGILEGNEEELQTATDDLFIDQLRNAVVTGGRMSEQRVYYNIREEGRMQLSKWLADRIDTAWINQLTGNAAVTDTRLTGSNATVVYDSDHVVWPVTGITTEGSITSSYVMNLQLLDYCVEKAKTLDPLIRPIMVDGQAYYAVMLHPYQIVDLRTSTDTGQWLDIQKAAMQGGQINNNPIFTGAHGVYNNVIIHESPRIPTTTSNIRRGVFFGAQSATMAFGQASAGNKMDWVEQNYDYENKLGIAVGLIWGVKKTRFDSADFAAIGLPTYAVAHGA